MRIIAGDWRGRKLRTPKQEGITRPTADRTRETLFSMLASRLGNFHDLQVLDLFAGTGALGLEALSRGAAHCHFVEQDPIAVSVLQANITQLDAMDRSTLQPLSVLALGKAAKTFDLVLMDPPYGSGAAAVALDKLSRFGWFAPSTLIVIETGRGEAINSPQFTCETERNVGKAKLHFLRSKITGKDVG